MCSTSCRVRHDTAFEAYSPPFPISRVTKILFRKPSGTKVALCVFVMQWAPRLRRGHPQDSCAVKRGQIGWTPLRLLTLLEPQSRSGDKPVNFQVVLSPNGTAVLKVPGISHCASERRRFIERCFRCVPHRSSRSIRCSSIGYYDSDTEHRGALRAASDFELHILVLQLVQRHA